MNDKLCEDINSISTDTLELIIKICAIRFKIDDILKDTITQLDNLRGNTIVKYFNTSDMKNTKVEKIINELDFNLENKSVEILNDYQNLLKLLTNNYLIGETKKIEISPFNINQNYFNYIKSLVYINKAIHVAYQKPKSYDYIIDSIKRIVIDIYNEYLGYLHEHKIIIRNMYLTKIYDFSEFKKIEIINCYKN